MPESAFHKAHKIFPNRRPMLRRAGAPQECAGSGSLGEPDGCEPTPWVQQIRRRKHFSAAEALFAEFFTEKIK
jgi:hypothetical protein